MHGLINRSIQCFLRDTYGGETWANIVTQADIGIDNFEAMSIYDDALTTQVLAAAETTLNKQRNEILEDLGNYLASHPNVKSVRRILRFGGVTYTDFLHSLNDLKERARLAVPQLELPALEIRGHAPGAFTLYCTGPYPGAGHVFVGVLRAMADDYGALVLMDHLGNRAGVEAVSLQVLETSFAEGRAFELSERSS
jgi:hypothetical protein